MLVETNPVAKKILIVDDEEDILEFLSYHFKKNHYQVFTCLDGLSALSVAFEQKPDIIISDIRMPYMDGIEMCRTIKKDETLKNIPLLFLTADDSEYVALLAHQCGADFYLNKPVKINVIVSVVNSMVNQIAIN